MGITYLPAATDPDALFHLPPVPSPYWPTAAASDDPAAGVDLLPLADEASPLHCHCPEHRPASACRCAPAWCADICETKWAYSVAITPAHSPEAGPDAVPGHEAPARPAPADSSRVSCHPAHWQPGNCSVAPPGAAAAHWAQYQRRPCDNWSHPARIADSRSARPDRCAPSDYGSSAEHSVGARCMDLNHIVYIDIAERRAKNNNDNFNWMRCEACKLHKNRSLHDANTDTHTYTPQQCIVIDEHQPTYVAQFIDILEG